MFLTSSSLDTSSSSGKSKCVKESPQHEHSARPALSAQAAQSAHSARSVAHCSNTIREDAVHVLCELDEAQRMLNWVNALVHTIDNSMEFIRFTFLLTY